MKRHTSGGGIPSLSVALSDYMNSSELKKLVSLTGSRAPARKEELVGLVRHYLDGEGLRTVWRSLDELQRAAVAEVVHSPGTYFAAERFRAKYGRDPSWGSLNGHERNAPPTALRFFFYGNGVMPDDLKGRLGVFVPPPAATTVKTIDQLPDAHDRPSERWNAARKTLQKETEQVGLTVRESERAAQRELVSVLRLVDAGKIARGSVDSVRLGNTQNQPSSRPAFGYLRSRASGIHTPASPAWRSAWCWASDLRR